MVTTTTPEVTGLNSQRSLVAANYPGTNRCLKMKFALALTFFVFFGTPHLASADEIAGLWIYESFDRPAYGVQPLVGLFLFNDGRFVHQAMHGSEPMEEQLTDAHIGRYRFKSGDIVQFDVDTGIVVTPAGEALLSARSNTSHDVGYKVSGENLFLSFANGATEKLVKVPNTKVELIDLERGTLALTDRHFILVTEPEGGWLAGSGRYEKTGDDIRFEAMRWFEVRDGKVSYAADGTFEATFDSNMLKLTDSPGFRVSR